MAKFAAGVVDTGGKFAPGVVDTGGARSLANISTNFLQKFEMTLVKVGPPVHNYEHEAGSYGDGFT